jgi:trehalose 6-phosphate phosphatase
MKDLFQHWPEVEGPVRKARRVCALTDFDGTLTPIVARPEDVVLSEAARRILRELASAPRAIVGVVSGRALSDVCDRVGVPGLWYVGNHGFEWRTPSGEEKKFYDEEEVRLIARIGEALVGAAAEFPGALVENKGPIVTLHFRRVQESLRTRIERTFSDVVDRFRPGISVTKGRMVLEVRPRSSRNKGIAVRQIVRDLPSGSFTLYFGDDETDRDVFRFLKGRGSSVQVGDEPVGGADYSLADPEGVLEVLGRVNSILRAAAKSGEHSQA